MSECRIASDEAFVQAASASGISAHLIVLAALLVALHRHTHTDDVVVRDDVHGVVHKSTAEANTTWASIVQFLQETPQSGAITAASIALRQEEEYVDLIEVEILDKRTVLEKRLVIKRKRHAGAGAFHR
jgi:hypothetical protein